MAEVINETTSEQLPTVAINATVPQLKAFDPNNMAAFGNDLLKALIQQASYDEEIAAAVDTGEQVRKFIGFELSKAVMTAHEKDPELNIFAIFEGGKKVEKLNTRLLQMFGVVKKEIKDDEIVVSWTDPSHQKEYDYSAVDKDKDEAEYTRRFNNRKRLNMRLSDACKFAIGLLDGGTKAADLKIVEENGSVKAVIENAPEFLVGDKTKNNGSTTVEFGKRNPNEGAKVAPTLAAVIRVAADAHKKAEGEVKPGIDARADKGNDRSGDAKLGISDEDFGAIVNNLRRVVSAQEGEFTPEMIRQLQSIVPFLDETLTAWAKGEEQKKKLAAAEVAGEGKKK
jgi:hypothetical protein